jgi:16S rRNA (guanine(966)-N(2))-methyltransferase RsmD
MRVISGTARGRSLLSPANVNTRPTSEKVKEAIFSSLQGDLPGAVVLDLFSGSGQLGIESLSRGADFAYFVECERQNFDVVKKNVENCAFGEKSRLYNMDARLFLKRNDLKFDIVFLDPPYGFGLLDEVLPLLSPLMNPGGIVVCEHEGEWFLDERADFKNAETVLKNAETVLKDSETVLKDSETVLKNAETVLNNTKNNFKIYKQKKYGKVNITMFITDNRN